ncbi:D-alanyl-D-alanine carboxypeptidase family protein [Paenibacillus albiflavus]|nr:D-alanyl-D-alanine carboxypeptidase family protein [Paenibacillus albiflavus]
MKSKRYNALFIALLAASLLLTACGGDKETSETNANASPAPVESVKPNKLTSLEVPQELILEPGAETILTVIGVMKDGSKADVGHAKEINYESSNSKLINVNADGTMVASATANTGDTVNITVKLHDQTATTQVTIKTSLQSSAKPGEGNKVVVTNPTDRVVVVNKERALPEGYVPPDLVYPNVKFPYNDMVDKRKMRSEAAKALENMFEAAKKENVELAAVSGYRSYATQKSLFAHYVQVQGLEVASQVSAKEGFSEHQTGLTMDVSSASAKFQLEEFFGETKEGMWLAEHAHEYGFIIRYPKGKEQETGYAYEPWHIRYVGENVASVIKEKNIILEQYFDDAVPVQGTTNK